jgi:heat shock protein HslJ
MKKSFLILIALINIGLLACEVETVVKGDLNGTWKVVKLDGKDVTKENATCVIDVTKNNINGTSGCNAYNAAISLLNIVEQDITFGAISQTKIGCIGTFEQEYFDALRKVNYFEFLDENTLQLKEDFGKTIEFKK